MARANCGGLLIDGVTLVKDPTTRQLKVASGTTLAPDATTTTKGIVKQSVAQADSTATDIAGLKADFNALLAKLRTAGILAV